MAPDSPRKSGQKHSLRAYGAMCGKQEPASAEIPCSPSNANLTTRYPHMPHLPIPTMTSYRVHIACPTAHPYA